MSNIPENIHPPYDQMIPRKGKEALLHQRAKVIWLTGLSGSGKSTLANELEKNLQTKGFLTMILDGDNVRAGINSNLGFSDEDRKENIRRIAEVAKLFLSCGVITICSFVSPTEEIRKMAASIIGTSDFIEIYINTPLEECERRDVKGLYAKARKGEIKDFTGINAPFEEPANPSLIVKTKSKSIQENLEELLSFVLPLISQNPAI